MINVRLHFIFFQDEISDLYTRWIEFDSSISFEEISAILEQEYRHLLFDTIIDMGLKKDYVENLITQIDKEKGRIDIEFCPITLVN